MNIARHPANPIVVPGKYDWRKVTVFNPAVIIEDGKFYMIERTAESLTPAKISSVSWKATTAFIFAMWWTSLSSRRTCSASLTAAYRTRGSSKLTIPST
ncbi:hypothetical protein LJK88_43110 [Paenibacillus sp. P26]|nr:hypothetical protein LJK88_43110 [Paenibacillus sp. P26]